MGSTLLRQNEHRLFSTGRNRSAAPCLPFRTEWPLCAESRLRGRGRLDERRRGITVHGTRSTLNSAQGLALCAKPQ